jgi:hypothetical protein
MRGVFAHYQNVDAGLTDGMPRFLGWTEDRLRSFELRLSEFHATCILRKIRRRPLFVGWVQPTGCKALPIGGLRSAEHILRGWERDHLDLG